MSATLSITDERLDGRFSALVTYEPWDGNDPIPFLVTIYDAKRDTKAMAYWRGSEDEAREALTEWVDYAVAHGDDDE